VSVATPVCFQPLDAGVKLICPQCRAPLTGYESVIACPSGHTYGFSNGFPDLIIGGRFDDSFDEGQLQYEERFNAYTTENYWVPLFRRLWPESSERPRVLSLGCGTAADVDTLHESGFDCIGIDCGNRTSAWTHRKHTNKLMLANGKHLPFEDASFDGIFCGCVFPHVGVVGDSSEVTAGYQDERFQLAREMTRVLRPGGKILVSSPNRLFPFDIFHGRPPGCYVPRANWPGDPFLLSSSDYRKLFRRAGCSRVQAQSVKGYWGFLRSRDSVKGRLLSIPVRLAFRIVSIPGLNLLRGSPLTPWIVVMAEKDAR
jgi:SAM-dependent methyltransferase